MVEILWTHDNYNGPQNGLALYNDEKLWFQRNNIPPMKSSTDIDVPTSIPTYTLSRLAPDVLQEVEEDHVMYCLETGAPLKHGDPYTFKRPEMVQKNKNLKDIDLEHRLLSIVKKFIPRHNPLTLEGEYVKTISENEFTNYRLPKRVKQ